MQLVGLFVFTIHGDAELCTDVEIKSRNMNMLPTADGDF
jgi:hypothetical protein